MANILVKFNSALTDLISWANLRSRHIGWSEESKGLWFKRPLSEAPDDPGDPVLIPSTIGQGMGRRYTKTAHGFSVGTAIRYSGGDWVLASAAAFESLATHVVVRVLDANRFDADSSGGWDIGVGISGPVYLSATVPGALTGTRPTTGAVQVVGVGIAGVTWIVLSPGDGTLQLDVAKGAPALPGGIGWNAGDGAAEINQGGGVILQVGQESQIPVRNVTGAALLNGKVGIITGSSGERPTAALASVSSLATSKVLGVFTQNISNNQIGKMSTFGLVRAIPLDFPEGAEVFLSVVDGGLSTTPAPGTRVRIGVVVRSHATNGTLFVSIDRTPLLSELPDIDLTGAATADSLFRESDGTWASGKVTDARVAPGAAIAWAKVSKVGAVPGDIGAMPHVTLTGAIDFNDINGGAPCMFTLRGSSYANAPGGATTSTGYSGWQGVGLSGRTTQMLFDTWYGGPIWRYEYGDGGPVVWSAWAGPWDDVRLPIGPTAKTFLAQPDAAAMRNTISAAKAPSMSAKNGSWTLDTNTTSGIRQTASGTLTLPAASTTYGAQSYTITATTNLTLTIAGSFVYLNSPNSSSYWYDTATSVAFEMNGGHVAGLRKQIELWCDGAEWYVKC